MRASSFAFAFSSSFFLLQFLSLFHLRLGSQQRLRIRLFLCKSLLLFVQFPLALLQFLFPLLFLPQLRFQCGLFILLGIRATDYKNGYASRQQCQATRQ